MKHTHRIIRLLTLAVVSCALAALLSGCTKEEFIAGYNEFLFGDWFPSPPSAGETTAAEGSASGDSGHVYAEPNPEALRAGMANLLSHVKNIREVWQTPVVVALNRFATDTAEELGLVSSLLAEQGVACAPCNGWAEGGKGTMELARLVCDTADQNPAPAPSYTYPDEASLADKIRAIATRIYHASEVSFAPQALKDLAQLEADGFSACPVCIAKTQYSMSDDPSRLGAPEGYALTIRSARLSAGAGFVVAFAGSIIAMPGLPKVPAALSIDVDENGEITGLF